MSIQFFNVVLLVEHSVDVALLRLVVGIVAVAGQVAGGVAAAQV